MTDALGWPDASKPGVPANPEKDGWHWLRWPHDSKTACVEYLAARADRWPLTPQWRMDYPNLAGQFHYLGPCHTPQEVAAREAAAAEAMREKIAQEQMCGCEQAPGVTLAMATPGQGTRAAERLCGRSNCAAIIAAEILETPLPAPDALARALAEARREGMLAAAGIAENIEQQNRFLDCAEASMRDCLMISGRIDGAHLVAAAIRAAAGEIKG